MSNADIANQFLRGQVDVQQYWNESGQQQVRAAGVYLTQYQQVRVCKSLQRLSDLLRRHINPSSVKPGQTTGETNDCSGLFDRYLASLR